MFLLLALAIALPAAGQENPILQPEGIFSHSGYQSGGKGTLAVVFNTPPGHHITSLNTGNFYIEIDSLAGFRFETPRFPAGVDFEGDMVYRGKVPVLVDFSLDKGLEPGEYRVKVSYGYQICREAGLLCYIPEYGELELALQVLPPGTTPFPSGDEIFQSTVAPESEPSEAGTLAGRFSSALAGGSITAFLLVFLAGILTSFTPCVYPVIPITVGYIGARADGRKSTGFVLALFLVLGMALVYSTLGVIAAATGSVFGAYTQRPAALITAAVIFALMGASMLGAFTISLPASMQTKLQTRRTGFIGAVLVGMVTGLVAAPCVGPVLVALLAWVAGTGNIVLGFLLLFTYAVGLGLLFIVIGTFAGAMGALPGAGKWMETVKHIFGFALLAGALFILNPLLGDGVYHLLWGIILIFAGISLGALDFSAGEGSSGKSLSRGVGIILLAGGLLFFIDGFKTTFGLLSPPTVEALRETGDIDWVENDAEGAFALAQSGGKGVVIDFRADWCVACRELEEKTWPDLDVVSAGEGWVFLQVDLTRPDSTQEALRERYEVKGLPTVIFLDSEGKELHRFFGYKPPKEAAALLREL